MSNRSAALARPCQRRGSRRSPHPRDVPVKHRQRHAIRDAEDSGGRVLADPGKPKGSFGVPRKFSRMPRHNLARRAVQVSRTAVIAETGPVPQHAFDAGPRQRTHVRKARKKSLVIGNHRRHARLLQHDLRDPDFVGIPVAPPREIAL